MSVTYEEVKRYVEEMKTSVQSGKYRIAMNGKRMANLDLFREYVIDEEKAKEILLELTVDDFCDVLPNEHAGFEHERLYVFGKKVRLVQRFGTGEEDITLYIKFHKLADNFVIIISFYKQKYPLTYTFR